MQRLKVVKIVSDREIVANGGKNKRIEKGDIARITVKGTPIIDPATKEELGTLDIIKAELEVDIVYEKMCVCKTKSYTYSPLTSSMMNLFKTSSEVLDIDPNDITELTSEEKKVKIGDEVLIVKPDTDIEL